MTTHERSDTLTGRRHVWRTTVPTLAITLGIYVTTVALLLGRGTFYIGVSITLLGLLLQFPLTRQGLYLNRSLKLFLGVMTWLLIQGSIAAHGLIGKSPEAILWCLITAVGVFQLSRTPLNLDRHALAVRVMLIGFVVTHLYIGDSLLHKPEEGKSGLFSGIHYMAEYAVLTLPILVYLSLHGPAALRLLMALALLGDFWLLLESRSRPGYLAMLASAIIIIPLATPRVRWKLAAILISILGVVYFGEVSSFSARMDDLAANFKLDERWEIWVEASKLQSESTWSQWLFGHGLGQYGLDYQGIAAAHNVVFYLAPHNFFLEILYSHGLTGLVGTGAFYAWFLRQLVIVTLGMQDRSDKHFGLLLLAVAVAQLVHGFFTIPFFSRDYLLPFSLLAGISCIYFDRAKSGNMAQAH